MMAIGLKIQFYKAESETVIKWQKKIKISVILIVHIF